MVATASPSALLVEDQITVSLCVIELLFAETDLFHPAVSGVTIESSTVKNSENGIRIKTVSGATGSVEGVTFSDITLSDITTYGIVIEQDYENGSPVSSSTESPTMASLLT